MTSLRVVQWATGGVGSIAVAAIAEREGLDLVGVLVHDPAKVGRDAGDLAGVAPLEVTATDDVDALLALGADCCCYAASGEARADAAAADIARLLAAGTNVVTTSLPGLVFPPAFDATLREQLDAACTAGGTSLYVSGIEPGFAADHLVLVLSMLSRRITSVRTQELFSYADYPVTFTMFDVFGFGRPPERPCLMEIPGVQAGAWGPPVKMVAHHLGAELDEVRETYEKRVTDRRLHVASGVIEAGTVGAVRFETIGVIDGRDAIVIEHVNRMAPDLAPDWTVPEVDGTYRIVIEGDPDLTCDLRVGTPGDASAAGMVATTMRCVNAIPSVCAAPPGILTAMDLGLTLAADAFGRDSPSG
jgi:2,4-diaminopentanoate dehydrogenase